MPRNSSYACIVVGAGHAGTEAALAIARAGFPVLLLTMNLDSIGQMSCNPSIGGIAKGHMVREIDALGGEMGLAIDSTGIQFRMLNRSNGPAVWAPRAQADKKSYQLYIRKAVEREPNIDIRQEVVEEVLVHGETAIGVRTQTGKSYYANTVILTTGTFLQGLMHIGEIKISGGRGGESAALRLSNNLIELGFELGRFKTGTPPRLHSKSIDFSRCEIQLGDDPPRPFSFRTEKLELQQLPCFITHTNENTHEIIRKNLHRSPLYSGDIKGIGPRYCPSIEDKVVRFSHKKAHQIFLEPEGRETAEIYVNGISTSLPQDVQEEIVHSIQGLENAEIMRLGYAVEYDYVPPTQLHKSLETKRIHNLFFAGQINGTTGYEEAAAQGIIAAYNIIRRLMNRPPFVLERSEAYIGVLIDDLVSRGTNEPYRMFTSLAEYRLVLRQDNANDRLMRYGYDAGLIREDTFDSYLEQRRRIQMEIARLKLISINNIPAARLLRRPRFIYADLPDWAKCTALRYNEIEKVSFQLKYEGYLKRQESEIKRIRKFEYTKIPSLFDYYSVAGLSKEAQEKLSKTNPMNIAQASRVPGISQCDLASIIVSLQRSK